MRGKKNLIQQNFGKQTTTNKKTLEIQNYKIYLTWIKKNLKNILAKAVFACFYRNKYKCNF